MEVLRSTKILLTTMLIVSIGILITDESNHLATLTYCNLTLFMSLITYRIGIQNKSFKECFLKW